MDEQKKISLPEIIIVILFSLIGEVLDIVDMGWIIGFPIQIWLFFKGGGLPFKKQAPSLIGNLVELIPILDWLPWRTVTSLISIYLINHPEVAPKLKSVGKKIAAKQ